ncbi:MAG: sn-glycerol-3-phosphate ABC transporter ATP-binding protein UgpC [Pusillimonas sp.]
MAKINLRGLCKRFEDADVVHDVNLDIDDGEFIVLVGPSGCGKSTTLRMIAGLEAATSGEVRFDGELVNHLPPSQRNVAMVFQSYALYPHMTVARNMAFALEQRNTPKNDIKTIVERAADMLNIKELLGRKPKALSGGQRQRVAMGRAIVRNPDVFLFDEPLSNLDAALRTQMRLEIKKLHQLLKTTVVYVTHDQIEAMTLADRVVVMDKGQIVQVGAPMDVYERPRTRFVAGFIGAPRMNFVPAAVRYGTSRSLELDFGEERWPIPESQVSRFSNYIDKAVEIGIRPEHVTEGMPPGPDIFTFNVTPTVVEPTGADTLVFFSLNGIDVSVRCRPDRRVKVGRPMDLSLDFKRIYLIDPESGLVAQDDSTMSETREAV